jgi:hypothetical protein
MGLSHPGSLQSRAPILVEVGLGGAAEGTLEGALAMRGLEAASMQTLHFQSFGIFLRRSQQHVDYSSKRKFLKCT